MISLTRSGPETISMKITDQIPEIRHKLSAWGSLISIDPESSLKKYGAARRLVFLQIHTEGESTHETYVSETPLEMLLASLINSRVANGVESIGVMPGYIMMRLMGDIERGILAIQKDLGGEIIDSRPFYRPDIPGTSSIIYFTPKSLAKPVQDYDIYHKSLLVSARSKVAILQYLSLRGIEYLGTALGTPDWNDVEIKICDSDKLFELHRQRLLTVIHGLQMGMVLEEKWEMERALSHRTLPVYMMKLYTPFDVHTIKKLAMGLEYNDNGQRFADFDVYYNDQKVSAFTVLSKFPGKTRNDIGLMNRNEVLKNINLDSMNELMRLEAEIERERKKRPREV
ncbi:MAG: hypothetical protein IKT09_00310 [Synergistes sp.]|nr:hypothetical protein [Synergistes sp.]